MIFSNDKCIFITIRQLRRKKRDKKCKNIKIENKKRVRIMVSSKNSFLVIKNYKNLIANPILQNCFKNLLFIYQFLKLKK
jgi:hypothetical protein